MNGETGKYTWSHAQGFRVFFFFQLFLVLLGDISNIGRDESRREREKEGRREGDRKRERD